MITEIRLSQIKDTYTGNETILIPLIELLKDFPIFNPNASLNEFGKPGPKCVINDIKSISHNYENFYEFINSENFLLHISKLTGIGNLLPDPQMYGGGTHENTEGAELDCHIIMEFLW